MPSCIHRKFSSKCLFYVYKTIPISWGGEFDLVIRSSDLENIRGGLCPGGRNPTIRRTWAGKCLAQYFSTIQTRSLKRSKSVIRLLRTNNINLTIKRGRIFFQHNISTWPLEFDNGEKLGRSGARDVVEDNWWNLKGPRFNDTDWFQTLAFDSPQHL